MHTKFKGYFVPQLGFKMSDTEMYIRLRFGMANSYNTLLSQKILPRPAPHTTQILNLKEVLLEFTKSESKIYNHDVFCLYLEPRFYKSCLNVGYEFITAISCTKY